MPDGVTNWQSDRRLACRGPLTGGPNYARNGVKSSSNSLFPSFVPLSSVAPLVIIILPSPLSPRLRLSGSRYRGRGRSAPRLLFQPGDQPESNHADDDAASTGTADNASSRSPLPSLDLHRRLVDAHFAAFRRSVRIFIDRYVVF